MNSLRFRNLKWLFFSFVGLGIFTWGIAAAQAAFSCSVTSSAPTYSDGSNTHAIRTSSDNLNQLITFNSISTTDTYLWEVFAPGSSTAFSSMTFTDNDASDYYPKVNNKWAFNNVYALTDYTTQGLWTYKLSVVGDPAQTTTCASGFIIDNTGPTLDSITTPTSSTYWALGSSYDITVKSTDYVFGGDYGITALINYNDSSRYRGAFAWHPTVTSCPAGFVSSGGCVTAETRSCTGGGYAFKSSGFGASTVTLNSCTTSVSGNQRTVTFNVTPGSSFGDYASNDIGLYATDVLGNTTAWTNFNINFDSDGTSPTVTLNAISDYYGTNWGHSSTISGTTSDALSGVYRNYAQIYDSTTGQYWTGAAWSSTASWKTATGTTSWYYTIDDANFTSGHTYQVRAYSQDNAGNSSGQVSDSFVYDTEAPAVTAITSVAGDTAATYYDTTDNSSTLVVYSASADATACKWHTSDVAYDSMSNTCTSTTNCTLNLSGNGDKTVYFRCADVAGNKSASSYTLNYTIDSTPPTITSITSVAGDTAATYYDTTDNSSTAIVFVSSGATTCKWNATDTTYASMANTCASTTNCVANLSGNGSKTVYLRCADAAGNPMTTSTSVTYVIDSTLPTSTVTIANAYYGTNFAHASTINGTAADTNGISAVAIQISNGTNYWTGSAWGSATWLAASGTTTWTYTIDDANFTSGATYTITSRATDGAGNVQTSYGTDSFVYDTVAPTTTGAITAGTAGSNGWYTSNVTYTLTPADATSGVASTVYCVDTANTCTPSTSYSTALTLSTESATNYVRWASTDTAGNVQTTQSSGAIKIDKTSPTATSTTENDADNYVTNATSVTITSDGAEATSGVATCLAYWDANTAYAGTETSLGDLGTDCDGTVTTPDSTDGTWYYCVRPVNGAGLTNYSCTSAVTYDETAPGVPTMTAEPTYTVGTSNTVASSTVTDNSGGVDNVQYQFCRNTTNSTTSCTASGWLSSPSYTFTSLTNGQIYYYFAQSKDSLGNTSAWSTSTYSTQDASVPSGTFSNDGAKNEAAVITYTASYSDVSGVLIAWDTTSSTCASLGSYGSTTTQTQTLNEPGTFGMSIKVKDNLGNESACLSSTATWNNVAPTANAVTGSANEGSTVALAANVSDPGSTTFTYQWYTDAGCTTAISGATSSSYTAAAQSEPTSIVYYYKTWDAQSSASSCASATATWNNVAPTVSALVTPADNTPTSSREFCATVTDTAGGTVTAYFVIGGTTYAGSSVTSGSNSCYTHTADLASVSWYAYAKDTQNAQSANSATRTAIVDATAPTGTNLSINSGATHTAATAVTLTNNVTGATEMRFKNESGGTFSSWVTYAASYAWNLVSGDGLKTVYSEFRDTAGNVLNTLSDSITLDTTSPTGATVETSSAACETITFTVTGAGDGSGAGLHATPYSFDGGSNWQANNYITRSGTSYTQTANSIKVQDALGNITTINTGDVTGTAAACNGAPAAPGLVSPANNSYTNDSTPTLSATYSDTEGPGTTHYRLATSAQNCLDNVTVASGTSSVTGSTSATTTWTPSSSIGSDGTYYWCAQNDDGSLTSAWTSLGSFTLDTAAPETTLTGSTPDSLTNSRAASFSFTGGNTYECKLDAGNYSTCTSPQSYSDLTDGSHTFMVRAIDLALNTDDTPASHTWTIDATAPVITITNPNTSAAQSKTVTASVTSGDTLSKKEIAAATTCDGTVSGFEAYAASVFSTEAGNGQKVCYKATDTAGNVTYSASNTISGIDTTAPTITVNNPGSTPATTKTLTASATESATLTQKVSTICDGTVTGWVAYTSVTFSEEDDNGTTVCYRAVDAAGNTTYQLSDAIAGIDRQAPTGTISIAGGATYTGTTTVTLNNDVDGAISMQFKNDGGTYSGWMSYLSSYSWNLTSGEGLKKVYGQFKDTAGNILTIWDDITLDQSGPSGTMTINNDAATAYSTTVTLNSSVAGATEMRIKNETTGTYGSWQSYSATVGWVLENTAGTRTVVVEYRDAAQNVLEVSDTIELNNNSAPSASNVGIRGLRVSGSTLTGIYTYSDTESDVEGSSTYQWYRFDDQLNSYVAIAGANATSYVLTDEDAGTFVTFGVVPQALSGNVVGAEVRSVSSGKIKYLNRIVYVATTASTVTPANLQNPNDAATVATTTSGQVTLPTDTSVLILGTNQSFDISSALNTISNPTAVSINGMNLSTAMMSVTGTVPESVSVTSLQSGTTSENITFGSTDGSQVYLPENVQVYASGWDGLLTPPRDISGESYSGFTINGAIAVGATNTSLVFDKPVKVTVPTITGTPYYRQPGAQAWTPITTTCTDANGTGIVFPNECYYKNGAETYIWTYHFTEYAVMTPTENGGYTGTNVYLNLEGASVTIDGPASVTFPQLYSGAQTQESEIALTGTGNYFLVDDLKGADQGYETTLQMSDMVAGSFTIPNTNIVMKVAAADPALIAGSENTRVKYNSNLYSAYQAMSGAISFLYRDSATNDGLLGRYGVLPTFRITIPSFQSTGSYSGTLTYTLISS